LKKYAYLNKKFATLIADNKALQNKFNMLEKLYQDNLEKEGEGVEGKE